MTDELKSLCEEVAKLRERVAVLEAQRKPVAILDWSRPLHIGTPLTQCPAGSPYTVYGGGDYK